MATSKTAPKSGKTGRAAAKAPKRSLLQLHPRLLVGAVITLLAAGSVLPVALAHHVAPAPARPVHKVAQHVTLKKTATPKPVATAKPAPAPTPAPAPAPAKPVVPPSPAPTVSSVAAAPGSGASSLTPTPAAATPPATTSTTSTSSTSSTSSTTTSPGTTLPPATANYTSLNWAGYFMSGANYTSVSGAWTVPDPSGNGSSTSADATWIGIGGASTQDLIQVGTSNLVDASGGVSSTVFYELLPDAPIYPSSITVSPGDTMTASLKEQSAGQWLLTIGDTTQGETFTTTVRYTSSHSSAEWIEEDPSYASGGLVPFDGFGTAYFSGSSAVANGSNVSLLSGNAQAIALVTNRGRAVATPTVLGSDGASFNVVKN